MKLIKILMVAIFSFGLVINSAIAGGKLIIASNASDQAPRAALKKL